MKITRQIFVITRKKGRYSWIHTTVIKFQIKNMKECLPSRKRLKVETRNSKPPKIVNQLLSQGGLKGIDDHLIGILQEVGAIERRSNVI